MSENYRQQRLECPKKTWTHEPPIVTGQLIFNKPSTFPNLQTVESTFEAHASPTSSALTTPTYTNITTKKQQHPNHHHYHPHHHFAYVHHVPHRKLESKMLCLQHPPYEVSWFRRDLWNIPVWRRWCSRWRRNRRMRCSRSHPRHVIFVPNTAPASGCLVHGKSMRICQKLQISDINWQI